MCFAQLASSTPPRPAHGLSRTLPLFHSSFLSLLSALQQQFFSGELGPSTIVGSAAFNLLIIVAVCTVAIPPGDDPKNPDGRKIADLPTYTVTCTWGIFAYVWLIIILVLPPTPDICTFYEGLLTFLFFPTTVTMAYMADKGMFTKTKVAPQSRVLSVDGSEMQSEAAAILKKLDNPNMTNEEKAKLMVAMSSSGKPSRAVLRQQAVRSMSGGKRVVAPKPSADLMSKYVKAGKPHATFFFGDSQGNECSKYAVLESNPNLTIHVMRVPAKGEATIKYKSVDIPGGAKAGEDYEGVEGTLTFKDGENTKDIQIKIMDDEAVEEDEKFLMKIFDCSDPTGELSNGGTAEITIVDDDEPGEIGFLPEDAMMVVKESTGKMFLTVKRSNGSSGSITVKYKTVVEGYKTALSDGKRPAKDAFDFDATSGSLTFGPGEIEKKLPLTILDDKIPEPKNCAFEVVLFDCVGPVDRACLSATTVVQVNIVDDENTKAIMDLAMKLKQEQDDKYKPPDSWAAQFSDALEIERDEDDEGPITMPTYIVHFITLPWKLLFATTPPASWNGGWTCFFIALLWIGVVTGFIGDLAALFGCAIGMPDNVTAITFVALGTSLPDTFASKAAALSDDSADAAVGNVTGSNAVNVFLGLGLPWLMASFYWDLTDIDSSVEVDWLSRYKDEKNIMQYYKDNKRPGFAVPAGSLGPSVIIFVACALTCVGTLAWRRQTYGMELGGPQPAANYAATLFACLWGVYIVGSIAVS